MRVLIVVPWDQELGGVASVVGNLAAGLTADRHHVRFLHPGESNRCRKKRTAMGFAGYELNLRSPVVPGRRLVSAVAFWLFLGPTLWQLGRIFRKERIEVVNVHYPLAAFLTVALAARLSGRTLVTSIHGADLFPGGARPPRYPLALRLLLRLSHRIVAPSSAFRDEFLDAFPSLRDRSAVVHNGIDLSELERGDGGAAPVDPPYVLAVAALNSKKGHDALIPAFREIAARWGGHRLVLAGDGPLRERLEALADELGLAGRVLFLGQQPRDRLIRLLKGCDLFVLPSRSEPFGIAAVEAMACGRPVVASSVGGLREIVEDGRTGLLVEPGDTAALARAMDRLLGDPDLGGRLGEAGRRAARAFDARESYARYAELFRKASGAAPARSRPTASAAV